MRFGERLPPRFAGLRSRVPLYVATLVAIAFCFVHQGTIAVLVSHAGGRSSYLSLTHNRLFLLVLLEAAAMAGVAAVVLARWASWPVRAAVVGSCAGSIPELVFPVLALADANRQPIGVIAVVTTLVDTLSLPGRGLAALLGYSPSWRWAVGLSDPPIVWVAQCWSIVIAGDVLVYALATSLASALLARRRSARGEPQYKSLKRTRFARRLAQVR